MPNRTLAAIFLAVFAALITLPVGPDLTISSASAQKRPDCARPSSVSNCSGPDKMIACAQEGTCQEITGELTQGCLDYICKTKQNRAEELEEELKAYEEAKKRK